MYFITNVFQRSGKHLVISQKSLCRAQDCKELDPKKQTLKYLKIGLFPWYASALKGGLGFFLFSLIVKSVNLENKMLPFSSAKLLFFLLNSSFSEFSVPKWCMKHFSM